MKGKTNAHTMGEYVPSELVTITVTGTEGVTPEEFEITIVDSNGTVIAVQTTTSMTHKIKYGVTYSIVASNVEGYFTPSNQSYTASQLSRNIELVYTVIELGVFIQDIYGKLYTEAEWDGTHTANGIAVLTDNCRFVIALEDAHSSYCRWGGYGTEVSGITTAEDESEAQQDYDGGAQTTTIINALKGTNDGYVDGAPAAEYCRAYTFPDGSTGYMGAAGEWQAALDNKSAIKSALSKCGGGSMSDYYWTSTQYSSNYSWYMNWFYEFLGDDLKSYNHFVRAFSTFIANKKFIKFTIGSIVFNCIEGITWQDFCGSAFNTSGYKVSGSDIVSSDNRYKIANVSPSDTITANASYTLADNIVITWASQSGGTWTSSSNSSAMDGKSWVSPTISHSESTVLRCTFNGITSITFNCKYQGESNYDYLTVGKIDTACTRSSCGTSLKGTSGTAKDITFTCDGGEHYVEFCYSKDSSDTTSPDQATVYIKSYE